jgi:hypothetical protein
MTSAVFKKGVTTRIRARFEVGGNAANLTGKTVTVKADDGTAVGLLLNSDTEVQSGATLGYFWFECTAANLATLNNPAQVTVVATAFNVDNTLFMDADAMVVAVEL